MRLRIELCMTVKKGRTQVTAVRKLVVPSYKRNTHSEERIILGGAVS